MAGMACGLSVLAFGHTERERRYGWRMRVDTEKNGMGCMSMSCLFVYWCYGANWFGLSWVHSFLSPSLDMHITPFPVPVQLSSFDCRSVFDAVTTQRLYFRSVIVFFSLDDHEALCSLPSSLKRKGFYCMCFSFSKEGSV